MLTRNEFMVLNALRQLGRSSQRRLAEATGLSLGTVNSTIRTCEAQGYCLDRELTESGLDALRPYKVDNAIIMAAGMSERFVPISYEKPKGLLRVRGKILIQRQIRQLQKAGITDITVVVGYRKEYFFYLIKKYGVKIVVNDEYATRNNNGSLWRVREELGNTYICSSDNYFTKNPFEDYVYQAYYSAQYVAGPTDEWCLKTGSGGRIIDVSIGGADAYVMLGHAYFDRTFSDTFTSILEQVYERPETVSKLWEAIYLDHIDQLNMVIRPYPDGVIQEFDSLDELRHFDPDFIENVDSEVFDNIVSVFGCEKSDIYDFYPLKQGITNLSCHFAIGDDEYVYRHPGIGTEKIIDRKAEASALLLAGEMGLDNTYLHVDPDRGWKITRFVPNARNLDVTSSDELRRAMQMDRKLHESGRVLDRQFDFITEGLGYEAMLKQHGPIDVPDYHELRQKVLRLKDLTDADQFPIVPSHNDFFHLNFLVNPEGELSLIDWEYAGMSDEACDFGTFVVSAELSPQRAEEALEYYFDREPTFEERRHFWAHVVFAGWCWYIWALLKEAEGDNVGEWLLIYYEHAVDYIDQVLAWYQDDEISTATAQPREVLA